MKKFTKFTFATLLIAIGILCTSESKAQYNYPVNVSFSGQFQHCSLGNDLNIGAWEDVVKGNPSNDKVIVYAEDSCDIRHKLTVVNGLDPTSFNTNFSYPVLIKGKTYLLNYDTRSGH